MKTDIQNFRYADWTICTITLTTVELAQLMTQKQLISTIGNPTITINIKDSE